MAEGDDLHRLGADTVSDEVGRSGNEFSTTAWDRPPSFRQIREALAGGYELATDPIRGRRVEPVKVGEDVVEPLKRFGRPDHSNQ